MDEEIRSKKLALIRSKNEARKLNDLLHRVPDSGADDGGSPRPAAKMEEADKENGVCGREITMRQDLAPVTQIEVHTMLDWVRTVPGFSKLQMEDQLSLLKRSVRTNSATVQSWHDQFHAPLLNYADGAIVQ